MDTTTEIQIDKGDLGVWFSIDGKGIKNQVEMDLALIALAENYGFFSGPPAFIKKLHEFVHGVDDVEEISKKLTFLLIDQAEKAIQFLNNRIDSRYKFDFSGEEFENFGVYLKD